MFARLKVHWIWASLAALIMVFTASDLTAQPPPPPPERFLPPPEPPPPASVKKVRRVAKRPLPELPPPVTRPAPPHGEEAKEFSLALPRPDQLYRATTEAEARQAIREASIDRGIRKVSFPPDPKLVVSLPPDGDRPSHTLLYPPSVVCHRTLYFEDPLSERCGESLGVLEPARTAFLFYGRTLLLPAHLIWIPPWEIQCQQHE